MAGCSFCSRRHERPTGKGGGGAAQRSRPAAARRKGKWSGGTPLLGYDTDGAFINQWPGFQSLRRPRRQTVPRAPIPAGDAAVRQHVRRDSPGWAEVVSGSALRTLSVRALSRVLCNSGLRFVPLKSRSADTASSRFSERSTERTMSRVLTPWLRRARNQRHRTRVAKKKHVSGTVATSETANSANQPT